jgi:hypothetical protein
LRMTAGQPCRGAVGSQCSVSDEDSTRA